MSYGRNLFELYEDSRCRLSFPHFELYHSGIMDWCLRIYEQDGIGSGAKESEIVNVQGCDLHYVIVKGEVLLKEWLLDNKGGY